ncbi:POTRA domain-containing protein [Burkholderia sp. AU6039]|uniref:POTRA domain-containing protein n=1 Tax=Burkholderia sp. AU6039 TaxID=2015344 RepID=UPI0015C65CC8|nr:POTRA domain-containing protein [Burkholderia sp. AU6039]
MKEAADRITACYLERGHVFAHAYLPRQDITATALTPRHGMPVSTGALARWNFGEISNVTAQNVNVAANGVAYIGGSISKSFSSSTLSGGRDSNLGVLKD